jgi:hypothetical protein
MRKKLIFKQSWRNFTILWGKKEKKQINSWKEKIKQSQTGIRLQHWNKCYKHSEGQLIFIKHFLFSQLSSGLKGEIKYFLTI